LAVQHLRPQTGAVKELRPAAAVSLHFQIVIVVVTAASAVDWAVAEACQGVPQLLDPQYLGEDCG
jgi:hypothetical protein